MIKLNFIESLKWRYRQIVRFAKQRKAKIVILDLKLGGSFYFDPLLIAFSTLKIIKRKKKGLSLPPVSQEYYKNQDHIVGSSPAKLLDRLQVALLLL